MASRFLSALCMTGGSVLALGGVANPVSAVTAPAQTGVGEILQPQQQLEDAYILGPGDVLDIRLVDAPDLSGPVTIMSDGTVSLPLIGSVRLSGLTLQQATLWFRNLFSQQLLEPMMQLSVVRPRPIRIAVVGEVQKPGVYVLSDGRGNEGNARSQTATAIPVNLSAENRVAGASLAPGSSDALPTVVEAIQRAGGITQNSDLRNVVLQRRLPGERIAYKQAKLDLLSLILQGDLLQNPLLFDGDTIRIPLAQESVEETMELASANFSPPTIKVNVIGEVQNPGTIQLMANTPLVQAVLAAGGPKYWRANTGNIDLVRINRNGTATFRKITLNLSQGASNEKNPPLRDGDTVRVNRSVFGALTDSLDALSQPINGVVNTWALFTLFNNNNNSR